MSLGAVRATLQATRPGRPRTLAPRPCPGPPGFQANRAAGHPQANRPLQATRATGQPRRRPPTRCRPTAPQANRAAGHPQGVALLGVNLST